LSLLLSYGKSFYHMQIIAIVLNFLKFNRESA
jgi:hypothetical protein